MNLTRKDSLDVTPLQTALGEAGGFGFGGRRRRPRGDRTVIAELTGVPLPGAGARAALAQHNDSDELLRRFLKCALRRAARG